jgi:replicative DNA helicase
MPDDPQLDALKPPPHSLEAKQSVLGGLLLDNDAVDRVADVVSDADFHSEALRLNFRPIVGLVMPT